jgi:predicted permease
MMFWKRLTYLLPWRRRAAERDMREELRSIAEMATPGELGNLTLAAEDARAQWGWTRLEQTIQDLRYAVRTLRRSPGFTATAVLSLALGIGANTALFTLINTITWKLLPVSDPEELLLLGQQDRTSISHGFTYQQYQLIRDHNQVMDLATYSRVPLNVSIEGHVEATVDGQLVSGNYFSLLGVRAARGRLLNPDDDRVPMGHPVAVISHGYWKSRFARDPEIVGRQVSLSGVPFTIVGVTPPEFFGVEVGTAPKLFVPVMMQPIVMPASENWLDRPTNSTTWLRLLGRLRPGISLAQAAARLDVLAQEADWRPRNKFSGQPEEVRLALTSAATGLSDLRTQFSLTLLILTGVVGIVLLIACANTGNLVLARSAARRSEFALRLALGAGRSRLIRQVLVEGVVLAGLAGACGVVLAYWATQALVAYASAGRSAIVLDVSPDVRVLAFTAVVSTLAGLLFGSAPAIRASRLDMTPGGRQDLAGARHALSGPGPGRALVVSQVALSLVLLIGAGLFVRSLQNLNRQETGIDRTRVVVVRIEPRGSDQRGVPGASERLDRIYRDLIDRIERIPGVQSASLAHTSPMTPISYSTGVHLASGGDSSVRVLMVYPRYFATMGLAIAKGRDFTDSDLRPDSPLVAVVNEAFVREVLKGHEPLGAQHGATVRGPGMVSADRPRPTLPLNIIGVVKDSPYPNLRAATPPIMYQTFLQTRTGRGQMVLHVKVTGSPGEIDRQIREAVQETDRDVPIFELHTLADEVDAALVRERLIATLSGFFGAVALVLVCVGLYGVMAFTVSRRTAEIGIRVALGATRSDVRWMIARQTLMLVLVGIAVGLPAAWMVGRLASRQISGMLFELTPSDPITMTAATLLLAFVGVCAGLLPARRATRINPIVALRNE